MRYREIETKLVVTNRTYKQIRDLLANNLRVESELDAGTEKVVEGRCLDTYWKLPSLEGHSESAFVRMREDSSTTGTKKLTVKRVDKKRKGVIDRIENEIEIVGSHTELTRFFNTLTGSESPSGTVSKPAYYVYWPNSRRHKTCCSVESIEGFLNPVVEAEGDSDREMSLMLKSLVDLFSEHKVNFHQVVWSMFDKFVMKKED